MNEIKTITHSLTDAKVNYIKHSSGLSIYVMEMEGFCGTCAMFGTKYGSVNTTFKTKYDDGFITVPEGVAHFLEHKLFENEESDTMQRFAKAGASDNAYTSFDSTVYHFDCTDNFYESLDILLDFVTHPYFTQETVDKEQGIIAQEIKMCEDNPYRRVYFNLLRALYKVHPVNIEIAGTVDSISKIDADLLYRCYNTFYNLNNMVLAVAGNCDTNKIISACDKALKPSEDKGLEAVSVTEPEKVNVSLVEEKMPVGIPLFSIGFKSEATVGRERLKNEYISSFLLSLIFGQTSRFYEENSLSGLINSSLESETLCGDGYFSNILSGESKDPLELSRLMKEEIIRVSKQGIDPEEFEMQKRSRYARIIKSLNRVSSCATRMLESHFAGIGPFESCDVLANLELCDLNENLLKLLDPENMAVSIIYPDNLKGLNGENYDECNDN